MTWWNMERPNLILKDRDSYSIKVLQWSRQYQDYRQESEAVSQWLKAPSSRDRVWLESRVTPPDKTSASCAALAWCASGWAPHGPYPEIFMATEAGIRLEFSDDRLPLTAVAAINTALSEIGTGVWPLDLRGAPDDIRQLLMQPALTDAEVERLRTHFLLPRQRLLEIMAAAGREPHVPGGGALTTSVANHDYAYPQLWIVKSDVDYTRFDRFHVNVSADGIGVDEVLQVLAGGGVVIRARQPSGVILTLRLDCLRADCGWLVTYDGGKPHMGSLSGAKLGTKVMVQAIGPERWALLYRE